MIYLAFASRTVIPAARFGDLSYGLYIYGWPAEQAVVRALGGAAPWWEVFLLALPRGARLRLRVVAPRRGVGAAPQAARGRGAAGASYLTIIPRRISAISLQR